MQGFPSKHTPMQMPTNQIKSSGIWVLTITIFYTKLYIHIRIHTERETDWQTDRHKQSKAAIASAWTFYMPGHNLAVNTSLPLNWPKSAPGFWTTLYAQQTAASFDLHTKSQPEPQILIFLTICLLLVCALSQLLGEHRLPRGDQRGSACSSLWSSFSQRINICTLSSSLCRWAS